MKRLRMGLACMGAVLVTAAGTGVAGGDEKPAAYCPAGFVNVMAFGAKGDGKTDDTDAFQLAANSGGGIFIPAGDFRISKPIYLDSRVMAGAGAGQSVITFTGEDPRQPIIQAGSYTSLRDLTLRFADGLVTGGEQQGDRTAILTGAAWALQRGASLRRVVIENVGTGVLSPAVGDAILGGRVEDACAFSVTFEDVTVRDFSFRGMDLSAEVRTGNVFRNLYFTSRFEADSAVYFSGEESETVLDGLMVENVRAARPVYMFGMRAMKAGNIALYETEATVPGNGLVTFEDVNGSIDSLTIRDCRAGELLIRLGRGDYYVNTGVGSPESRLEVGTLLVDTVTAESLTGREFAFFGRSEGAKGRYTVDIGRYLYATVHGDEAAYETLRAAGTFLTVNKGEGGGL